MQDIPSAITIDREQWSRSVRRTSIPYEAAKRTLDILTAAAGIVVTSPFIVLIAMLIKLDSNGPSFYKGQRVGKDGVIFEVIKFRSMVENAAQLGDASTPDDDPRITRIGATLRRFKLDELPQLFNVFWGEMSMVGPRPQVPWYAETYPNEDKQVFSVRPGIADYAFVMLPSEGAELRGSTNPDRDYFERIHPAKMKYSLEYLGCRSFWFDTKVLVDTALLSFFRTTVFFTPNSLEDS